MIGLDKIPVRYGPYTIITDVNEHAGQYHRCRSPARARRRLDKKGIVGRILLGMPSLSLAGTVLRVHPYNAVILKAMLGAAEDAGMGAKEALRWAISMSPALTPRMWRPERND